ncbi:MAG: winged helix-turn-helix transcriptional regulator [Candidatus Helarchaeota archaeon]
MKNRYYFLIIIMILTTLIIPILQITRISQSIPSENQVSQTSTQYMQASDMNQYNISSKGVSTTILIISGSVTFLFISLSYNIFADHVFNKESSLELEQDSRSKIYYLIKDHQGIHLREICRKLDKKMGVIQYHIHVLEKANLIDSVKEGRYRRFFIHNNNGTDTKIILCFLQRESSRKILEYLLFNDSKTSHRELADFLGISSQAITWHMKKFEQQSIVSFEKIGKQKFYSLTETFRSILLHELT